MEGRWSSPREGQSEYLHPDYLPGRTSDGQGQAPDVDAPSPASRSLAVKLIVMAMVMIGLLVGVMVIFT
jgi:hypothetical protein